MKRYLMISLAVLLFSTAASAQTNGYLGLFMDTERTAWCGGPLAIPGNFTVYIYALPNTDGMYCAEFKLQMPDDPTLFTGLITPNPGNSVIMGDLVEGVSFCFLECQTDWVQIYSVLLIATSANTNVIQIVAHPEAGGPWMANCVEPDRPMYPAVAFTNLYVNYDGSEPECGETATAERTWGAIKSMYTE